MAKQPKGDEPRRVESPARMAVAEEVLVPQEPVMKVAQEVEITTRLEDGGARVYNSLDTPFYSGSVEVIPPFEPAPVDPEIAALFPTGTIYRPESGPDRPWYPIEVAPRDGALLEALTTDGSEFLMVWRTTSRFNAKTSRWEPIGFWSSHLSREPIKVEPVSWRRTEGFAAPGMLMT